MVKKIVVRRVDKMAHFMVDIVCVVLVLCDEHQCDGNVLKHGRHIRELITKPDTLARIRTMSFFMSYTHLYIDRKLSSSSFLLLFYYISYMGG